MQEFLGRLIYTKPVKTGYHGKLRCAVEKRTRQQEACTKERIGKVENNTKGCTDALPVVSTSYIIPLN